MEFKDFFDIDLYLFNPKIFYEGYWMLDSNYGLTSENNILIENAKVIKGKNMYLNFLEEEYYKPMSQIFNSDSFVHSFFPKIVFDIDDNTKKRTISFDYCIYLSQFVASLGLVDTKEYSSALQRFTNEISDYTKDEMMIYSKKLIREEMNAFRDVLNKDNKSEYYNKAYELYKKRFDPSLPCTFKKFIQIKLDSLAKLNIRAQDVLDFYRKRINTDKLTEAFDYDKFCLLAAYTSILQCNLIVENIGELENQMVYIKYYLDTVNEYRKLNPNYNVSITIFNDKGKKEKYYINDLEKAYYSFLSEHPDFEFYTIEEKEIDELFNTFNIKKKDDFDLTNSDDCALLYKLYEKMKLQKQLAASWEFLPAGNREKSLEDEEETKKNNQSSGIDNDEAARRMIIGKQFIETNSGVRYLYVLHGINTFAGYIGYIYPNGTVVFEKYYENEKKCRIAQGSATYVMGIYNFLELSKLSKSDIIKKLHNDPTLNVKRIFHREDMEKWKSELMQAITGNDYTREIVEYIESLTNSNELFNGKNDVK